MKLKKIECLHIEFREKDVITLKNKKDFLGIVGEMDVIYTMGDMNYLISFEVVWIYKGSL